MSRIQLNVPGGLSQTTADGLYVNEVGDTMTGSLVMDDGTDVSPSITLLAVDGTDTVSAFWTAAVNGATNMGQLAIEADYFDGSVTYISAIALQPRPTASGGSVIRHTGHCVPEDNAVFDLGEPTNNERWRDLYLTRNLINGAGVSLTIANARDAYDHSLDNTQAHSDYLLNNAADVFGGTLTPSSDGAFDFGTTTAGIRQVIFSDDSTGSNRAKFRGCKTIGYSGADIYWGIDDIYPGYFVQKTVVAGSTATTSADDYTNLYQGDTAYQFIAMMFDLGRTVDGSGNPTNGVAISDGAAMSLGCPLVIKAGIRFFELYVDGTNQIAKVECGKTNGTRLPKMEIRLAGTGPAIRPYQDDSIDLGESSLEWKDIYIDGTAAIDICRVDEQLIVPSGTADPASTVGSLFLRTDLGTNGTLRMYANGAWRTVTAL